MEGKDFFTFAQKLTQMRTEPALRSAVSRAYYAVFHCCIKLLTEFGFKFSKDASAHAIVAAYFNNAGIIQIKDAAEALSFLRKRRNFADYDLASKEFQDHLACQGDLIRAHAAIAQIEKYSHEPLRTQLKNGLRAYDAIINPKSGGHS